MRNPWIIRHQNRETVPDSVNISFNNSLISGWGNLYLRVTPARCAGTKLLMFGNALIAEPSSAETQQIAKD